MTDKKDGDRVILIEDQKHNFFYISYFLTFSNLDIREKNDKIEILNIYDGELIILEKGKKVFIAFDYLYSAKNNL